MNAPHNLGSDTQIALWRLILTTITQAAQPLYLQLLREIENMILSGECKESERIPSVKALAQRYELNPATVHRGVGMLINKGVLFKIRGTGAYVCRGAYQAIHTMRAEQFCEHFIEPLLFEAAKLGFSKNDVCAMIYSSNW